MSLGYKRMLMLGILGIVICAIAIAIAVSTPSIALKWVLWIAGVLVGLFGLFLTLGSTIGSYFEIKKEGILGDSVKTSFVRRLKNPKYRQSIISKIIEAKDSGQEFRISNQDICRIFIDIEKAEKNLPKSTYNQLKDLYDINTLAKHKNGQSEWEQFNYRRSQESKTTIEDEESYYELLVSILSPYHKIASLDKYSGFNKRECIYVIEQIEKAEKEHREFISQIREVITPTADYDENTIEQRLSILTWDQKDRIAMQLEEIYHMKEFSKKSAVYLSNHTIEGMIWKAKNGAITQKEYGEFGLTYLLYKRKQEDTKPEKIQEKIDWIIKMLNYDPNNRNFVCGTPFINSQGEKYVSPKERWHQKVTETLANVRISNDSFESKVETLYELTEHIFNFFQIYPLCEIEQGDNEKIKNTIVNLAFAYSFCGKKEQVLEIANLLPDIAYSKRELLSLSVPIKERASYKSECILAHSESILCDILCISKHHYLWGDPEIAIDVCNRALNIIKALGDEGYLLYLKASSYEDLSMAYAKLQDKEKMYNAMEIVISIYEKIDNILSCGGEKYSSPLFDGLVFNKNSMSFGVPISDYERYYNTIINSKTLKPYIEDKKFKDIINRLQEKMKLF